MTGFRLRLKHSAPAFPPGLLMALGNVVQEGAAPGTVVSTIRAPYLAPVTNLALDTTHGNRFALSGGDLVTGFVATDFSVAQSYPLIISGDVNGSPAPPINLTVLVQNVLGTTLATLTLDNASVQADVAPGETVGGIVGLTSGSTRTLVDDAGGQFALNAEGTDVVVGLATLVNGVQEITIRETHPDGANSPLDSVIEIEVVDNPDPPGNSVIPAVTGTTTQGSVLTTDNGTWTNSPDTFEYRWLRAVVDGGVVVTEGGEPVGDVIAGATATTYQTTLADVGEQLFSEVRAVNEGGTSPWVPSNVVGPITSVASFADAYVVGSVIVGAPTAGVYTFPDVNVGPAHPQRRVVCVFTTNGGTACQHTGGTADAGATVFEDIIHSHDTANGTMQSMWIVELPEGTTMVAPKLAVSANPGRAEMRVFMHGRPTTPHASVRDVLTPLSQSISVPANGMVVAHASVTGTAITWDWGGTINEDYDGLSNSALYVSGGRATVTGAETRTITATPSAGSNFRMLVASFGAPI